MVQLAKAPHDHHHYRNNRHTKAHPQRRKTLQSRKAAFIQGWRWVQCSFPSVSAIYPISGHCETLLQSSVFVYSFSDCYVKTASGKKINLLYNFEGKEEIQQMMNTRTSKQLVLGKLAILKLGTLCCEVNFFYFTSYHCPCHTCIIVICRCYFVKVSLNYPQTTQVGFWKIGQSLGQFKVCVQGQLNKTVRGECIFNWHHWFIVKEVSWTDIEISNHCLSLGPMCVTRHNY